MGWLFAVALGLYQRSRRVVMLSLIPISLGHAISAACVLMAGLSLGAILDHRILSRASGLVLIGWAVWHTWRGHRMRTRVGMQAGFLGLTGWSFLMAGAHGAGLMPIPALLPMCNGIAAGATSSALGVTSSDLVSGFAGLASIAGAALLVHSIAMLITTAVISIVVFDRHRCCMFADKVGERRSLMDRFVVGLRRRANGDVSATGRFKRLHQSKPTG